MAKKLHKILAWAIGVWLLVICATGSLLLFKNELLMLQYSELRTSALKFSELRKFEQHSAKLIDENQNVFFAGVPKQLGQFTIQLDRNPDYRYVIYASESSPWHVVVDTASSHHYFSRSGRLLLTRAQHGDLISWARELHMHMLLHDIGEDLLGILSLASFVLLITGLVKWWPRHFSLRLFTLSLRKNHAKIYRQWHGMIGFIALPLLLAVIITSAGLLYFPTFKTILVNWVDNKPEQTIRLSEPQPKEEDEAPLFIQSTSSHVSSIQWDKIFFAAQLAVPDAAIRLVSLQQQDINDVTIRLKFPEEWHPNGRTVLRFNKSTNALSSISSARTMGIGETLLNMFYPVHMGAVGDMPWLILLTLTGLIPTVMMYLGWRFSQTAKQKPLNHKKYGTGSSQK